MEFKPGDKVMCIDDKGHTEIVRGGIYTIEDASTQLSMGRPVSFCNLLETRLFSFMTDRFILANDLSDLEKIIYGGKA